MQLTSLFAYTLLLAGIAQSVPIERAQAAQQQSLWGITYTAKNADGSCQSADQVSQTIQRFKENGIKNIRTYSQECNQLPAILNAIEKHGSDMTVLAAVWIDGTGKDDEEISRLESNLAKANNTKPIKAILVGNECVLSGTMTASALASKINQVKSKAHGFKVGTADTPNTFSSELVAASDIVVVNIHPFFSSVPASDAADNLSKQFKAFQGKAKGKEVLVGETGWPTAGDSNGKAVPSPENLATYMAGVEKTNIQYYFFESVDSNWKQGGTYGVENHWGLWSANGVSKVKALIH